MISIRIIQNLKNGGGITLKHGSIQRYRTGWQVADYGVECHTAEDCMNAIYSMEGNCGVWLENGIYYVDHSFRVNTKKEALSLGRRYNQISIYGWARDVLVYC